MTSHTITLKDGRALGYALYGPEGGKPVLYFHGTPSSRLELMFQEHHGMGLEDMLHTLNLKLIATDRPGMGLSTFNPKGNYLSFADDVYQLAVQLGISRCAVLCWSGGGPYALAVACQYPSLVRGVAMIAGFSRRLNEVSMKGMNANVQQYFRATRNMPLLVRTSLSVLSKQKINTTVSQKFTGLPYVDYQYMEKLEDLRALADLTLKEACRKSTRGVVYEGALYFKELGFPLQGIPQPVHYWWGTKDENVPEPHAREVERYIPNAVMHYREGEGHLSIWLHSMKEVLQQISLFDL